MRCTENAFLLLYSTVHSTLELKVWLTLRIWVMLRSVILLLPARSLISGVVYSSRSLIFGGGCSARSKLPPSASICIEFSNRFHTNYFLIFCIWVSFWTKIILKFNVCRVVMICNFEEEKFFLRGTLWESFKIWYLKWQWIDYVLLTFTAELLLKSTISDLHVLYAMKIRDLTKTQNIC